MPIYWAYEEAGGEVEIKNPDGSVRETRKIIVNNSRYAVDSMEEGEAMIRALASGEHEVLNERVSCICGVQRRSRGRATCDQ